MKNCVKLKYVQFRGQQCNTLAGAAGSFGSLWQLGICPSSAHLNAKRIVDMGQLPMTNDPISIIITRLEFAVVKRIQSVTDCHSNPTNKHHSILIKIELIFY